MLGIGGPFFNTPEEIDLWDNLELTLLNDKDLNVFYKEGEVPGISTLNTCL